VYLSFNSFLVSNFTRGIMVSLISTMPRFFESMCDASTTNLFRLARDRDPETQSAGEATRDKEDGGGMVTILDKVDQPLWSSNGDACIVLLEKRDLLFNLEVLGELQTR
jgi:hypothetical protein